MKPIADKLRNIDTSPKDRKQINHIHQLLERDEQTIKYIYSKEIWKFGYEHVPHRRWLFDRNRDETKRIVNYSSPIKLLIDHSNEHIYYYNGSLLDVKNWESRNRQYNPLYQVLAGKSSFHNKN